MDIRSFSPEQDLPALLAFRMAVEAADQDGYQADLESLRVQLNLPGHDPARDRWVAADPANPAQLAAYAFFWVQPGLDQAECNIVVAPAYRRRGLGLRLLERIFQRAAECSAAAVNISANAKNQAAVAFLAQNGFSQVGAYTMLAASLLDPHLAGMPAPLWPEGFKVEAYATRPNPAALAHAFSRCYAGLWAHTDPTPEEIEGWLSEWDPAGLLLVWAGQDTPAAMSRVEISQALSEQRGQVVGYIDAPGVAPEYRGKTFYLAMLAEAINWLRGRQAVTALMESWGDDPKILGYYQALGFTLARQLVSYQRRI